MALSTKKKVRFTLLAFLVVAVGAAAWAGYSLTSHVEILFAQEPNPVEEHEAIRKIKLFNEAKSANRQGFIRLSEVEINSFLNGRYNSAAKTNQTQRFVKAGVLLTPTNLTFVSWHQISILGLKFPFIWQRVVRPAKEKDGWDFPIEQMQIGKMRIPGRFWPHAQKFLGAEDGMFNERRVWLANVPAVVLTRNELSRAPELRLYTYEPRGGQ